MLVESLNNKLKILLLTAIISIVAGIGTCISYAQTAEAQTETSASNGIWGLGVGAGLAIGFAGLGAGIGLGIATSGIAAAGAERPEIIMRFFIFIVFIEAIAIYALIVAIFIITMLPGYL
mgnify:CR=1 FL=1